MRTRACFFYAALFSFLVFGNCTKAELDPTSDAPSSFQDSEQITTDRSGETDACDNIPPQTNFISLLMRGADGSVAPMTCLTEQEVVQTLKNNGKYSDENAVALSRLFYKAEMATPVRAFQLGQWMADLYGNSNKSLNIDVMGRADYPAPVSTTKLRSGPVPGFIDFYTIRQSRTTSNAALILQAGFSGVRFQNKCTGQLLTFNFPSTIEGFKGMFLNAGFSQKETDILVESLINGTYSIRKTWDLIQTQLVPKLPVTQTLLAKPDANCWRLRQVGVNLGGNADQTISSFYYAQGDGALK